MDGWGLALTATVHGGERIPYPITLKGNLVTPKIAPRICPRGHVITGANVYQPDNCRACRLALKKVREKKLPSYLVQRISDEWYADTVKDNPEHFQKTGRCLYAQCPFVGVEIPSMGVGFTFCERHTPGVLQVLQKQRETKSTARSRSPL